MTPRFGMRATILGGVVAASLYSAVAAGSDILADLHVDRVVVYPLGAVVTRAGMVQISAGTNRLLIKGLPATIETKSLQVTVDPSVVRLGGIEVERINEGRFVSEAERAIRRKMEQKSDQRAVLQDDISTAQLQLKRLDSLAANPAGSPTRATVDSSNLNTVLTTMVATSASARRRVRDANLQLRELDRELEQMKADLAKVATRSKQSTDVHAAIEATNASTAMVAVTYAIADASWKWIYAARLDTAKKRLTIERQGEVQQGSGEDWKDVEMTLTTAMPSDDVATPRVGSLFVDVEDPHLRQSAFDKQERLRGEVMAAPAAAPALQEIVLTRNQRRPRPFAITTRYSIQRIVCSRKARQSPSNDAARTCRFSSFSAGAGAGAAQQHISPIRATCVKDKN